MGKGQWGKQGDIWVMFGTERTIWPNLVDEIVHQVLFYWLKEAEWMAQRAARGD